MNEWLETEGQDRRKKELKNNRIANISSSKDLELYSYSADGDICSFPVEIAPNIFECTYPGVPT